uniref:Alkylated DNA repair dioxygenase AlkB n=1 Tax=Clandestinovirus TaxID=2831644 RepID=A0A8F8KKR6_9VIRU|nr:alkylated DNA repair dioxygenase AlkB [Clandestinovirus]
MTTRINLTQDGLSWIDVYTLPKDLIPTEEQMEALWNLHPEKMGKVKLMGKELQTPRWHQSYMKPYKFSGLQHDAVPLPSEVKPFLDFANSSVYPSMYGSPTLFNMCLINWYENGLHNIGLHSDDESEMVKTKNGCSLVFSISLGQERIFRLKPKLKRDDHFSIDVPMPNGTVVVMGGTCQSTHKHTVPKVAGQKGLAMKRRINLTFRQFMETNKRVREDPITETEIDRPSKKQKVETDSTIKSH